MKRLWLMIVAMFHNGSADDIAYNYPAPKRGDDAHSEPNG